MSVKIRPLAVTVYPDIDPTAVVNPGSTENGVTGLEESVLRSHGFNVLPLDPDKYGKPMIQIGHHGTTPGKAYVEESTLNKGPKWLAEKVRENCQQMESQMLVGGGKTETSVVKTKPCTKYVIDAATLGVGTEELLQGILKRINDPRYSVLAVHVEPQYSGNQQLDRVPKAQGMLISRSDIQPIQSGKDPELALAEAVDKLITPQITTTSNPGPRQFELLAATDDLSSAMEERTPRVATHTSASLSL